MFNLHLNEKSSSHANWTRGNAQSIVTEDTLVNIHCFILCYENILSFFCYLCSEIRFNLIKITDCKIMKCKSHNKINELYVTDENKHTNIAQSIFFSFWYGFFIFEYKRDFLIITQKPRMKTNKLFFPCGSVIWLILNSAKVSLMWVIWMIFKVTIFAISELNVLNEWISDWNIERRAPLNYMNSQFKM